MIRPFPEVETPHYKVRYGNEVAKYQICYGDVVLTEMIELDAAIKYAKRYIKTRLNEKVEELPEVNLNGCLYCYKPLDGKYMKVTIREI